MGIVHLQSPTCSHELPVTVILLTLNEEYHLPGALDNINTWANDLFIVDSCSTDRTVDIALDRGVKIVQRPFINFGDQWNFALERLPINTPWTMKLDPDERVTRKLIAEIGRVTRAQEDSFDGYWIPRQLWFLGKPLKVTEDVLRLWKTGICRFSDVLVNEHPLIDGRVGRLEGVIEHHDSQDLHHFFEKQNRYTTMEAIMKVRGAPLSARPALLGNSLEKRMFFKTYFDLVPFRFSLYWLYLMFYKGAWHGGYAGRVWAHLRVEVMRMLHYKVKEMKKTGFVPEIPQARHGDYDSRILASPLQEHVHPVKYKK